MFNVTPDVPPVDGDGGEDFDSPLRGELAEPTGAGLVGYDPAITYPNGTVGKTLESLDQTLRQDLADSSDVGKGAGLVAYNAALDYVNGTLGAEVKAQGQATDDLTTGLANFTDPTKGAGEVGFGAGLDYTTPKPNSVGARLHLLYSLIQDLALTDDATHGAGMVGFSYGLNYGAGTIGAWLKALALSAGASFVGFDPTVNYAVDTIGKALSDRGVCVTDFPWLAKGTGLVDDTAAIQAAVTWVTNQGGGTVSIPQTSAFYLTSNPINVGVTFTGSVPSAVQAYVRVLGVGKPTIRSNNNNAPVVNLGGNMMRLADINLQYTAKPASSKTDAIAIRAYNLAYSVIERIYAFNVFGLLDQYQGGVAGTGTNFLFSNTIRDNVCQQYSGWAIRPIPYVGGNSGNRWLNNYLNCDNGTGLSSTGATLGGMWLQTCQNEVIDLLNVELQQNAGPALVLNQCRNPKIGALHFEGLRPSVPFAPLIDVIAGDGSCPIFTAVTLTGNDWTGYGGAGQGALIRLDSGGARVVVQSLISYNNTTPANFQAVFNGGSTCYGSTIEFENVNDIDGSLSSDAYTPKVTFGTATAGVEYPLQRWNLARAKHSSLATDNAGGTNSTVAAIPGSVTSPSNDAMALWDSTNKQFTIKQSGVYLVQVLIPTASSPQIQVKQGVTQIAGLVPPTTGGHDSVVVALNRGDVIKLTLASGSYTRTGVSFGLSLVG